MLDDDTFTGREGDDDLPKSATITVVDIAGKKFVSGLFWQPLTKPRAYKKEAQEIGKREGMDIVTIRRSTIMQAGFAPKGHGAIKGMYSLSAALAGKLGNSWIGVFAVDADRYAFVAVDDGAIVPGCDVIGDHDDIKRRLNYHYSGSNWGSVYAPPSFDFGGEEANVADLLADSSFSVKEWRDFRLQPLKFGLTTREIASYAAAIGAVVIAGTGALQYQEYMARKDREAKIRAERIRIAELERVKANTKTAKVVQTLEHPWVKMSSVEDFLKGCGAAIDGVPLSLGGWLVEVATCDGVKMTTRYKRKDTATSNALLAEAQGRFDGPPIFAVDYESATLTTGVKILYGGDDVLSPVDVAMPAATSVFQGLGIQPKFVEKAVMVSRPVKLPGQAQAVEQEAPPMPDWKTYTFSFETDVAPSVLFASGAFATDERIPVRATPTPRAWTGMRLTKVEAALKPETAKLTWTVAGELYAK